MGSEPGMAGGHPGPQWWRWGQRGAWGLSLLVGGWCDQGLSPGDPQRAPCPHWRKISWLARPGALRPG